MHKSRLAVMAALSFALIVPLDLTMAGHGHAAETEKSCFAFTCSTTPPPVTPGGTDAKLGPFKDDAETRAFISLRPFVKAWKKAIKDRDQDAAIAAGLEYEIHWQAPEIWTQHRTFPAYQNLEDDNQFGVDAAIADRDAAGHAHQPQWALADDYMTKMSNRLEWIILNASNGPELSPNFTHLYHVRRARAYLNAARDLVSPPAFTDPSVTPTTPDPSGAAHYVQLFTDQWTRDNSEALNDVAFRRPTAAARITELLNNGASTGITGYTSGIVNFLTTNHPIADQQKAFAAFNARVGQGVNLVNAAARTSDAVGRRAGQILECAPSQKDFKNLELVKLIQLALDTPPTFAAHTAAAFPNLSTDNGSPFDGLLPTLEANTKSRYNLPSTALRTALRTLITPPTGVTNQAGYDGLLLAANDNLDLVRQTLWGAFWATPGLTGCDTAPGALASTNAAFA
jgi:hypothetical protein